jgi:uncharacterized protein YbjT (DUF2867 family)
MKILVTGATGYIGGRVIERLLEEGHQVRVLTRDYDRALARPWGDRVEIHVGDLLSPEPLEAPLRDVDVAYYLVHSMYGGADFAEQDRRAAQNFVTAGHKLKQVIYLGGIVPRSTGDSAGSLHLRSRAEVGAILRDGLPTTEFRAGPIIGSGSASFEMVRYLTERLPAMIAPRWILNQVQPIGVSDVLEYLIAALGRSDALGVIDVGSDPVSFRQMMMIYAASRGLPRLITPIPNALAVPLVEGVVEPVVGDRQRARSLFPEIEPMPYEATVRLALERIRGDEVETRWTFSGQDDGVRLVDREGVAREVRSRWVGADIESTFRAFSSLGGRRGWRVWNWAWKIRGLLDQLVGGPGLRRGRRHPEQVYPGEAIDFWRVEEVRAPFILRLRAEMKVPGKAWLQFEAAEEGEGTRLVQTAFFAPTGFFGWAYWYGIYPLHSLIFSDLVNAVADDAALFAKEGRGNTGPSIKSDKTKGEVA